MAMHPCTKLWQAFLEAALSDAMHRGDEGWIGTKDFRMTCYLADLDPEAVADRFKAGRAAKFKKFPTAA